MGGFEDDFDTMFFFRSLIKQAQTKSSLPSMDWSCLKRRRGWRRDARYLGDDHDGIDARYLGDDHDGIGDDYDRY